MSTWIEFRCENRCNPSSGSGQRAFQRCESHDNDGPMGMSIDRRASIMELLRDLENEARQSGWKRTKYGWICAERANPAEYATRAGRRGRARPMTNWHPLWRAPFRSYVMTKKEHQEHARLRQLWATQKATRKQILRCMELDRKAAA